MNKHYNITVHLSVFIFFVIVALLSDNSMAQENSIADLTDLETQINFFSKLGRANYPGYDMTMPAFSKYQGSVGPIFQHLADPTVGKKASVSRPIVGALLGGTVGLVAGGLLAYAIASGSQKTVEDGPPPILGWTALGGIIGESLLMPVGVHLGNKRQGNLALDLGTSAGVALGGLMISKGLANSKEKWLGIAALQIVATIVVERAAGSR